MKRSKGTSWWRSPSRKCSRWSSLLTRHSQPLSRSQRRSFLSRLVRGHLLSYLSNQCLTGRWLWSKDSYRGCHPFSSHLGRKVLGLINMSHLYLNLRRRNHFIEKPRARASRNKHFTGMPLSFSEVLFRWNCPHQESIYLRFHFWQPHFGNLERCKATQIPPSLYQSQSSKMN